MTAGALFKLSERLRMAASYTSAALYQKDELSVSGNPEERLERPAAHYFRIGAAMYPIKWLYFFADLFYQKYSNMTRLHPGFNLGMQLTAYGRPEFLGFLPEYGMIPFYIGYSHEPWDRVKGNQAKHVSFGSGYYLNNIYIRLQKP